MSNHKHKCSNAEGKRKYGYMDSLNSESPHPLICDTYNIDVDNVNFIEDYNDDDNGYVDDHERINSQSLEDTQVGYILQKYTLDSYTLERVHFAKIHLK